MNNDIDYGNLSLEGKDNKIELNTQMPTLTYLLGPIPSSIGKISCGPDFTIIHPQN
jgi:hypothetical protein